MTGEIKDGANPFEDVPNTAKTIYTASVEFEGKTYTDTKEIVKSGKWYGEAVIYCFDNGFMTGTSDTTFSPNGKFTRAMFVMVLARIEGADLGTYTSTSFADVAEGKWYSRAVEWAYQNGLTSGIGTDAATGKPLFGWNNDVTRQQLAQFLYTYSVKKGYDVTESADLDKFTDASDVSAWALKAVKWAVGTGLISGTTNTTISPKSSATRAQVAVIVMNYVKNLTK